MKTNWDVIIVGGGLAGLVAANFLARHNNSILLLEKGKQIGGRARTYKIQEHYFNLGPHAFYKKGEALPILEQLGVHLPGKSPKLGGILLDKEKDYVAPFTPLGLLSTKLLNRKERIEWVRILLKIKNLNIESLRERTFKQWVEQSIQSEKVQSLLYMLGRLATYCHAPEKSSASIIISHLQLVLGGVLYIDGGWQTIVDQLHEKAILVGVQVETEMAVDQINPVAQDSIQIHLSNGEEMIGKHVIYTGGPSELHRLVGDQLPNEFRKFVPVKGATLDVALSQLPNPKCLFAMGVTTPFYFSVHSTYASLSTNGIVLHVFKYIHPKEAINSKVVKQELEQFLEKVQPGWSNYELTSRFYPNITVNQRLPNIGDEEKLATRIPGLYVAGDWASPQAILAEAAISSGFLVAEEIMKKE